MATTVRRTSITLPAAPAGSGSPLPELPVSAAAYRGTVPDRGGADPEASRALRPVPTRFDAVELDNGLLRATVLPAAGGRLHSLVHLPTGRELLHPAAGLAWRPADTPLHAARVPAPDGGAMLRLWEWDTVSGLPFQLDLWLPEDGAALLVGVRIRNPRHHTLPLAWSTSLCVPGGPGTRVVGPAAPAARPDARRCEVPGGTRPWLAVAGCRGDAEAGGLALLCTDPPDARRILTWPAAPGPDGRLELRVALARGGRPEPFPLDGGAELSWLEAYVPLEAGLLGMGLTDDGASEAGPRARAAVAGVLDEVLPPARAEAARRAWLRLADEAPVEPLATGSGWGVLEALCGGFHLPGTPFDASVLAEPQRPWAELVRTGRFPEGAAGAPPGPSLVAPHWRDLLETAPPGPLTEYHLGVAQWHAGDRAQAVRSWERSLRDAETGWVLRALAVGDIEFGHSHRAADRYLAAVRRASEALLPALAREAVPALLAVGRDGDVAGIVAELPPGAREEAELSIARYAAERQEAAAQPIGESAPRPALAPQQ